MEIDMNNDAGIDARNETAVQSKHRIAVLDLKDLRLDGGTQQRVEIKEDVIEKYAEGMRAGDTFPPVVVFDDGERCVTGMQAAASRGRWVFPPPLGYRVALKPDGTKTIEPDPETAPLVRHAFQMAASGLYSVADILREVRRRGLSGRRGA